MSTYISIRQLLFVCFGGAENVKNSEGIILILDKISFKKRLYYGAVDKKRSAAGKGRGRQNEGKRKEKGTKGHIRARTVWENGV